MSKGKQWWPLQAKIDDSKTAILDFQSRLRDKQWLAKQETVKMFYIYLLDGYHVYDNYATVNDYMQFGAQDSPQKNQHRVMVLRMLALLHKWHIALRPLSKMLYVPSVFSTPLPNNGFQQHGLVVSLDGSSPTQQPITVIISEFPIHLSKQKLKMYLMPQTGDSFRWMTTKTWQEQSKKMSFIKWMGHFNDRRYFIEQHKKMIVEKDHPGLDHIGLQILPDLHPALLKDLSGYMIYSKSSTTPDTALTHARSTETKLCVLPQFWDVESIKEWNVYAQQHYFYDKPVYPKQAQHEQNFVAAKEFLHPHDLTEDPSHDDS